MSPPLKRFELAILWTDHTWSKSYFACSTTEQEACAKLHSTLEKAGATNIAHITAIRECSEDEEIETDPEEEAENGRKKQKKHNRKVIKKARQLKRGFKRPSTKTAKMLHNHSSVRAAQRYGIYLDDEQRAKILEKIKLGALTEDCRAIEQQSRTRTLFRVIIDGKVCGAVYDNKRHEIITFVPADHPLLREGEEKEG